MLLLYESPFHIFDHPFHDGKVWFFVLLLKVFMSFKKRRVKGVLYNLACEAI